MDPSAAAAMGSAHETMCAVSKVAGGVIVDSLPAPAVLAGSLAVTALSNGVVALFGEPGTPPASAPLGPSDVACRLVQRGPIGTQRSLIHSC